MPNDKEESKGFLKQIHCSLSAFRRGFSSLGTNLSLFLRRIVWSDASGDDPDDVRSMWLALDRPEVVATELAQLDPRLGPNGELLCNATYRDSCENLITRLSFLFLRIWQFRDWSDTRMGGQGRPLRAYSGAILVGADLFVEQLIVEEGVHTYYICQSIKMAPVHREFALIQGLATRPAERLSALVMEDDRVARDPAKYKRAFDEGVRVFEGHSRLLWKRLAAVAGTGISPSSLRAKARCAVVTSGGYIDRHLWRDVESLPWSLCAAPNVEEALLKLPLLPPAEQWHPMTKRLVLLVQRKWPMHEIVALIRLLALCHWSTLAVEQAHGSWAVMRKYHPSCCWTTLVVRAFCHVVRPLFRESPVDKTLQKLDSRHRFVCRREPETNQWRQHASTGLLRCAGRGLEPRGRYRQEQTECHD